MTSRLTHETCATLSRAFTLSPIPASVPVARKWVRQLLDRWDLAVFKWRTELLVTELFTNAIKHACTGGATVTGLVMYAGGTLRVEVHDRDTNHLPVRRQAPPGNASGHGLLIVETYADRWGVRLNETSKAVWCELDTPSTRKAVSR
ncbi:ATP-binding protein [Nonomuraea helvata]|uniref:ATP-binding protein n=1 Tax=Nonomuraea helvata TaxID=37484 RepID=A0ABV5SA46_9ACTN